MRKTKRKNEERGITLIALIVTIIVLLILARNQYYDVISEKIGILTKAGQAKTLTDESQIREEIQLAWNGVQVDGVTKGWDNSTKAGALNTELLKEDGNASATWNTTNGVIDVTYKGYETTINLNTGAMTALAKVGVSGGGSANTNALPARAYTLGEEITFGGEQFIVIKDSENSVELFAKYCLNLAGTEQWGGGNEKEFSNNPYWSGETYSNLNNDNMVLLAQADGELSLGIPNAVMSAKKYGDEKGVKGRLLTLEDLDYLYYNDNFDEIWEALYSDGDYEQTWMGDYYGDKVYFYDMSYDGWSSYTDYNNEAGIRGSTCSGCTKKLSLNSELDISLN